MSKFVFHIETVIVDEPAGFLDRVELPIEGDAIEAPVFETHKRNKNWSCYFSGKNAANAERHFLPQRGSVIDVSALQLGTAIEVAGDYYSSTGTPHPLRFIGVVTGKTDTVLTVDKYASIAKAMSAAHKGIVAEPLPDDSDVLEGMAGSAPVAVDPQTLSAATTHLHDWLKLIETGDTEQDQDDRVFVESIALVLQELKRLQQKDQADVAHTAAA